MSVYKSVWVNWATRLRRFTPKGHSQQPEGKEHANRRSQKAVIWSQERGTGAVGRELGVREKRIWGQGSGAMHDQERRLNLLIQERSASHESEHWVVSQAQQVSSEKPFRREPSQVTGQQMREASIMYQTDAKKASAYTKELSYVSCWNRSQ